MLRRVDSQKKSRKDYQVSVCLFEIFMYTGFHFLLIEFRRPISLTQPMVKLEVWYFPNFGPIWLSAETIRLKDLLKILDTN